MAKKTKKYQSVLNFFKFLIIGGSVLVVVGVLTNRLVFFLTHAELFKIRTIAIDPSLQHMNISSQSLEALKGKNIFKVRLGELQDAMRRRYPSIEQLRLIRHFPDRIDVVAQHRDPFALINIQGRNIVLDRKGIVVAVAFLPNLNLPFISGVRLRNQAVVGRPLGQREVDVALNVIRAFKTNPDLKSYILTSIDVSNLSSITFLLSNQMKIIIDDDKIYPKIRKLGILLTDKSITSADYRYIDLRFNEPTLGKTEKNIK